MTPTHVLAEELVVASETDDNEDDEANFALPKDEIWSCHIFITGNIESIIQVSWGFPLYSESYNLVKT